MPISLISRLDFVFATVDVTGLIFELGQNCHEIENQSLESFIRDLVQMRFFDFFTFFWLFAWIFLRW